MNLNQVLTLAGRLDDGPGADTPRERFRRFLTRHAIDPRAARLVIQQCQDTAGEQHRRALQDAIVLAGRYLGFLTMFGRYQHAPGSAPVHGEWESRRRLRVLLTVCTGPAEPLELRALADVVRDRIEAADTPRVGLCVTTALFPGTIALEETLRDPAYAGLRLISAEGILRMAEMVAARRLTHNQLLQVFNPDPNLDRVVDLLDPSAAGTSRSAGAVSAGTSY